jgi:hypothetical protein
LNSKDRSIFQGGLSANVKTGLASYENALLLNHEEGEKAGVFHIFNP